MKALPLSVAIFVTIQPALGQNSPDAGRRAQVHEEYLADVPGLNGPLGANVAFIPYQDGKRVVYGIAETSGPGFRNLILEDGRRFDGVLTSAPVLSGDRQHLAIGIGSGKTPNAIKWDVLLDGKLIEFQTDGIGRLVFSHDGKRLGFLANQGKQVGIRVLGEPPGPGYDWVGPPAFSPDNAHLIYTAGVDRQVSVILDHKVVWSKDMGCKSYRMREGKSVFSAVFGPDSKAWAAVITGCKGSVAYTVNGNLAPEDYGAVTPIAFTPDAQHFAYAGMSLKSGLMSGKGVGTIVIDGKPSATYDGLGIPGGTALNDVVLDADPVYFAISSPSYTADGRHMFYAGRTKQGSVLVVDGNPGPIIDAIITDPVASPDSQHIGYMALQKNGDARELVMVVDGKATNLNSLVGYKEFSFIEKPTFSPDGRFAIIVTKTGKLWGPLDHARRRLLLDGRFGAEYDCLEMTAPVFSPDGKHYVQNVRGIKDKSLGPVSGYATRIVVDGSEGPVYPSVVYPEQTTHGAAAAVYFAIKDGKLYRVTQEAAEIGTR